MSVKGIFGFILWFVIFVGIIAGGIYLLMQLGAIEVVTHRSFGNLLFDPYTTVSFVGTEIFRF